VFHASPRRDCIIVITEISKSRRGAVKATVAAEEEELFGQYPLTSHHLSWRNQQHQTDGGFTGRK